MPTAPVVPSLPATARSVAPRPGGFDGTTSRAGPSRDFAEVLEASETPPAETGAHAPLPGLRPPEEEAIAGRDETSNAPHGPVDLAGAQPIVDPGQDIPPLAFGPDRPALPIADRRPESASDAADPDLPPTAANPGLTPAPAALTQQQPAPASGTLQTLPTAPANPAIATATPPVPPAPDPAPGVTATTSRGTPVEGLTPPVLPPPVLRARQQGAPMTPDERPDRTGVAPQRAAAAPEQGLGPQAAPVAPDAAPPRLAEVTRAILPEPTDDPDIVTQHFDLRQSDALANRPAPQSSLHAPDLPRHMAIQLAHAARLGAPDRPVQVLLNPAELGHVRITLQTGDGMVNVTVSAERPETLDLMRRHIETLAQEFQRIGYRAAEFSFAGGHSAGSGNPAPDRRRSDGTDGIPRGAATPDAAPVRAAQVISDRLDLRL